MAEESQTIGSGESKSGLVCLSMTTQDELATVTDGVSLLTIEEIMASHDNPAESMTDYCTSVHTLCLCENTWYYRVSSVLSLPVTL